ncbi:hypothetical protein EVAR_77696_1 [Eumeta japonica]|uniref:Reverse transcriptase domain-containing protein n=1 Tax=Eumeta variegata TaxID=151549 RepID=A0A4C1TBP9_EUMVA|nr:hypothetical protein EVAR_77696_1 [Eumeta japonica]
MGVPRCPVLGPFSFLDYIDDVPHLVNGDRGIVLFAHDIAIFFKVKIQQPSFDEVSSITFEIESEPSCSSSMALCNRGRKFRRLFDLRKSAVSSAKSTSWVPVVGCGITFMYAEYSRRVEL